MEISIGPRSNIKLRKNYLLPTHLVPNLKNNDFGLVGLLVRTSSSNSTRNVEIEWCTLNLSSPKFPSIGLAGIVWNTLLAQVLFSPYDYGFIITREC